MLLPLVTLGNVGVAHFAFARVVEVDGIPVAGSSRAVTRSRRQAWDEAAGGSESRWDRQHWSPELWGRC